MLPSGAGADSNEHSLEGTSEQSPTYLTKLSAIAFALWGRFVTAVSFTQIVQSHFKPLCFEITLAVRHTVCRVQRILSCHVRDSLSVSPGWNLPATQQIQPGNHCVRSTYQ